MSNGIAENGRQSGQDIGVVEFVALMAAMMSLAALSTDAMLPALPQMGADLGSPSENANSLVVSLLFFGMAAGQLIFGPLSDSVGRKPSIYGGYALFIAGTVICIFAPVFWVLLGGRLIQGLGAAGPRGVITALIRDKYAGRTMARVMSYIGTVFILVPIIAPSFGQLILMFSGWRAIFAAFLILAAITLTWFALRQPETLPAELRVPLSARRIANAFKTVLSNRSALGYTIAAGLVSGAFFGYLNTSQQMLQVQYGLGSKFALAFALLAMAMGAASLTNARLVMRYGMQFMTAIAGRALSVLAVGFILVALFFSGHPPLWSLMLYLMATFFCVGILFGNLNSLAMEPLGKVAGVGAAAVGSLTTFIATPLGMVVGQSYNDTVMPLLMGFALFGIAATLTMMWAGTGRTPIEEPAETSG